MAGDGEAVKDDANEILPDTDTATQLIEPMSAFQVIDAPNLQSDSILYEIPQEIRNEIYCHVFSSTPLRFGRFRERHKQLPAHERQRYPLALLACCRRMRTEIGSSWLEYVKLAFGSPEIMLQKLPIIPRPLSSVRHVRVLDLMGKMPASRFRSRYRRDPEVFLHEFLRVLEGLRLEQLTVIAGLGYKACEYQAVELLLT